MNLGMSSAPLRPMNLGEILDRTFQIYKSRFWVFVGIAAFPAALLVCLEFVNLFWLRLTAPTTIPVLGIYFGDFLYLIGEYHFRLFFHAVGWGCIACATNRILDGERISVYAAYSICLRRWRSWLGMTSSVWLVSLVIPETVGGGLFLGVTFLASVIARDDTSTMDALLPPLMGFFIIAGSVFACWLGGVYLLAIPAWCAEQIGLRKIFQRAHNLSKHCRWRIVIARLLPATLAVILYLALSMTLRYLVTAIARGSHTAVYSYQYVLASSYSVISATIATFVAPIFPIALTLLYYDQRIRKEGYDIERMMDAAGLNESQAPVEALAGEPVPQGGDSVGAEVQAG
jgi:hypothetical protein